MCRNHRFALEDLGVRALVVRVLYLPELGVPAGGARAVADWPHPEWLHRKAALLLDFAVRSGTLGLGQVEAHT